MLWTPQHRLRSTCSALLEPEELDEQDGGEVFLDDGGEGADARDMGGVRILLCRRPSYEDDEEIHNKGVVNLRR